MSKTHSGRKNATESGASSANQIPEQRWETDWQNLVDRREKGKGQISDWNLHKRKTRHLARERDISRGRASHLMKHEGVEVPDEVVL